MTEADNTVTEVDTTVMGADVTTALRQQLQAEGVERAGDHPFVTIVMLDSGARLALTIPGPVDDEGVHIGDAQWAMVTGQELSLFEPERVIKFTELIENPRADIEERIERGAAEAGLPAESVLFSLPVVEIVRAMLAKDRPHFSRLSLLWLLPSELRALRADIAALVDNELLPRNLRDLAQRLVVPE